MLVLFAVVSELDPHPRNLPLGMRVGPAGRAHLNEQYKDYGGKSNTAKRGFLFPGRRRWTANGGGFASEIQRDKLSLLVSDPTM